MPTDFLYPVPELPPDEGTLWVVAFNAEWLPIVVDAVDNLQRGSLFDVPPADIEEQVDQLVKLILTPYVCPPTVTISKRAVVLHQDSIVIHGNAVDFILNTAQMYNGHWRQETAALNDEWTNGFYAPAGDYLIRLVIVRGASSGILDFTIDGGGGYSVDFYSAAGNNHFVSDVAFTLTEDGYHVISAKVNGKNGSSTGYRIGIISISILPGDAD